MERFKHRRENPSFSSSLLDSIYRSIDEKKGGSEAVGVEELIFCGETMRTNHRGGCSATAEEVEEMANFRRACLIEKWMEKKVAVRRKSMADFDRKSRNVRDNHNSVLLMNSSSSSSDSSSNGGFFSSESESLHSSKSKKSSCYSMQKPKPIRTILSPKNFEIIEKHKESGFGKTKSKAMKIYGDLKKVKQPISPGGKLANFLNSIFTNPKKTKISSSSANASSTSTCSSASSFSRSCLSKNPPSREKNGAKRSVRFCPVSVIVDEDCRPCGHKNLHEDHHYQHQQQALMAKNNYVRDEIKRYQYQKRNEEFDNGDLDDHDEDNEEEDEDDDAASYASSDLFELDHLSAVGIERYREELPVYETTYLERNRAIANGLIM